MTAYAKNRDIFREIAMSKHSYCDNSPLWDYYDYVTYSEKEAKQTAKKAREMKPGQVKKKLDSIENQLRDLATPNYFAHVKGVTPTDIKKSIAYLETQRSVILEHEHADYLVVRFMTYRNIPLKTKPNKKAYREVEFHEFVPFPPYETFVLQDNKIYTKYRAFYKNNEFCIKGQPTNLLTCLQNLMVDRISRQENWRGYPDIQDWRQEIMLRLFEMGLKFSEDSVKYPLNVIRNPNPFSYYTSAINNTLKRLTKNSQKSSNQTMEIADHLRHELEIEMELPTKPVTRRNYNAY